MSVLRSVVGVLREALDLLRAGLVTRPVSGLSREPIEVASPEGEAVVVVVTAVEVVVEVVKKVWLLL